MAIEPPARVGIPFRRIGTAVGRLTRRSPGFLVGLVLILCIVFLALFGRFFTGDPLLPNPDVILQAPSLAHPMGTDAFGRDVFARVVAASQLDLTIAFFAASIAFVGGTMVGAVTGFSHGWVDDLVMRLVDILQAFPAFILAVGLIAMLGNTVRNVVIAVAVAYSPYFIRLVRSQMITAREAEYARAARCIGNRPWRIMTYHLLPNCLGPAVVQGTLCLGWAILDAAGLSFLGLGIRPPTAEWGVQVADGTQYINSGQWWISVFPGLMIVIAVFGFNLIGDRLRRAVG
jgi:peptide/nickel transport system permease protein